MKPFKIFIVDDDPLYAAAMRNSIDRSNASFVEISTYTTGEKMLKDLNKKPDLIFLDFCLNGILHQARNGMNILKKVGYRFPHVKIIMLSAQNSIDVALESIENGAHKYLVKDHTEFVKINTIISEAIQIKEKRKSSHFQLSAFFILIIILLILFLINSFK